MIDDPRPVYRFEFLGGLSICGQVERRSITLHDGLPHRIRYRLDDLHLASSIGHLLPSDVADLLDVSAAVYISDRLAPRHMAGDLRSPGDRWHRRIHVVVPVRNPELWCRRDVVACLENLLSFLTDDVWRFEFVPRTCNLRPAEAQARLFHSNAREAAVTLLSGGLDSLFGLSTLLESGQSAAIVPVTVITNERIQRAVTSILEAIQDSPASAVPQVMPTRLHIEISGVGRPRNDRESTQRARAMLFLASGVGVAVLAGTDHLWVCENGVGAVGLPLSADHLGARSTRAMHPKTLYLMSRLAGLLLDRPISIENLGLFATKGELAQAFAAGPFKAAAHHALSCDRASYLRHGEACGKCSSCVLRRVALISTNLFDLADGRSMAYRTDWLDSGAAWNQDDTIHLLAMREQVERLRKATDNGGGFAALDRAFPDLFDVITVAPTIGLTEDEVKDRLIRLYTTYVSEFDAFVAKIDRPGWGRKAIITELVPVPVNAAAG